MRSDRTGRRRCTSDAELEDGDVLRTQDGETEVVGEVRIEQCSEAVRVYNLEIEESHTYYVSVDGVLVHNECGNELSEDTIKDAMKAAPLKPTQKSVSIPMVQRYLNRILNGEMDVPPIYVDGDLIVDGHHRYIASILAGIQIDIQNWTVRDSIDIFEWIDMFYDLVDWGGK